MIKEYTLQGLTCANCAAKIEGSVRELEDVSRASVNLMTTLLRIETLSSRSENLLSEIARIVNQHEPDVVVVEKGESFRDDTLSVRGAAKKIRRRIAWLIAGAILLAAGVAMEYLISAGEYAALAAYLTAWLLMGGKVIQRAAGNIVKGKIFDENFLMAVATIGALAIGEYAEAAGVMLFYQVGEFLQELALDRSKRTIARLMDIRPDYANVQADGEIAKVAPDSVRVGDEIIVKPGERVPLDGIVTGGESSLDTSSLTGEAAPRRASAGDEVLSGCVNLNGVLTIKTTKTFGQSTASKIIDLAQNAAGRKAPVENFITKFAGYYTPAVVALALLIAVIPPLLTGGAWIDWLNRGLIFLVISCPCALVISIPLGFFGGIGAASKRGVLVKGGNYLEALADLDIVVFDKTGTLTKGVFKVTDILPSGTFCAGELLEAAAKTEAFSNHPIALSILSKYGKPVDKSLLSGYDEMAGRGVSVVAGGRKIVAGNKKLMGEMNVAVEEKQGSGIVTAEEAQWSGAAEAEGTGLSGGPAIEGTHGSGTKVYVAVDGAYMGAIVISDEIKPDSRAAVAELKASGVRRTVMLTGDDPRIAEATANELQIDEAYGGLLPHEKVEKVEALGGQKRVKGKLAFVGDGVNDAPALALADVGVAMGGLGSDAAIEAADVVLMTDEPSKLVEAVGVARFTKRVVRQNIVFAIAVKILFLALGAAGVAAMWEAVFADVGVALLAVLNAMRVMRSKSAAPS